MFLNYFSPCGLFIAMKRAGGCCTWINGNGPGSCRERTFFCRFWKRLNTISALIHTEYHMLMRKINIVKRIWPLVAEIHGSAEFRNTEPAGHPTALLWPHESRLYGHNSQLPIQATDFDKGQKSFSWEKARGEAGGNQIKEDTIYRTHQPACAKKLCTWFQIWRMPSSTISRFILWKWATMT